MNRKTQKNKIKLSKLIIVSNVYTACLVISQLILELTALEELSNAFPRKVFSLTLPNKLTSILTLRI